MTPGATIQPTGEHPAETHTRPLPPGGPELIATAGLGDVHYLLSLGLTTGEIARRMFIREVALTEALKVAENDPGVD